MSEQEHQITDEEEPEPMQDLEVPEKAGEDVKGGLGGSDGGVGDRHIRN